MYLENTKKVTTFKPIDKIHQHLFVDCMVTRFYYLNWLYGCCFLSFVLDFIMNIRNFKSILSLFLNDKCISLKRYILYFYNNDKFKILKKLIIFIKF